MAYWVVHWDQIVQAIGTAVTIAGLIVVAPVQAGQAPRALGRAVRDWWLHRFLRRPRKVIRGKLDAKTPGVTFFAEGDVESPWMVGPNNIEQQLAQVRAAVDALRLDQKAVHAKLARRLEEVVARIRVIESSHAGLSVRVDESEQKAARLNTRGFPLAALGALIAGIAFWLTALWWIPLHGLALSWAIYALYQSRKAIKEGWAGA